MMNVSDIAGELAGLEPEPYVLRFLSLMERHRQDFRALGFDKPSADALAASLMAFGVMQALDAKADVENLLTEIGTMRGPDNAGHLAQHPSEADGAGADMVPVPTNRKAN